VYNGLGKSISKVSAHQRVSKAPKKTASNVKKQNSGVPEEKQAALPVCTDSRMPFVPDMFTDERVTKLAAENDDLRNKVELESFRRVILLSSYFRILPTVYTCE